MCILPRVHTYFTDSTNDSVKDLRRVQSKGSIERVRAHAEHPLEKRTINPCPHNTVGSDRRPRFKEAFSTIVECRSRMPAIPARDAIVRSNQLFRRALADAPEARVLSCATGREGLGCQPADAVRTQIRTRTTRLLEMSARSKLRFTWLAHNHQSIPVM